MTNPTGPMSRCPACGARVYVSAGSPTPPHEKDDGSGGQCTGQGQPSR